MFIEVSGTLFVVWCLFYVLAQFLSETVRGYDKIHGLIVNALVITFGIAIVAPWVLAVLGHIIRPHHPHHPLSLNLWLGIFYALVVELWFLNIWRTSQNAWFEAGIYCCVLSVVGAMLAIGLQWLLLIVAFPLFILDCGTMITDYRMWRKLRREEDSHE